MERDRLQARHPHLSSKRRMIDQLYHGDCMEILPRLPDGSIDLVLCDLPYSMTANSWDIAVLLDDLWKQYRRLMRKNGNIVLFSLGRFTANLIVSGGDLFRYKMVWVKSCPTNHLNAKIQPMRKYEDICVFSRKRAKFNQILSGGKPYRVSASDDTPRGSNYGMDKRIAIDNTGTRVPTDVLEYSGSRRKGRHSTEKPVDLCRYLIKLYTNPKDVVLDNTMGSGTSLVAAKLEGRVGIGVEKEERWFECARQRVEQAHRDLIYEDLFGVGESVGKGLG